MTMIKYAHSPPNQQVLRGPWPKAGNSFTGMHLYTKLHSLETTKFITKAGKKLDTNYLGYLFLSFE